MEAIDKIILVLSLLQVSVVLKIEDQVIRLHEKGPKQSETNDIKASIKYESCKECCHTFGANGVCKSINTACASSNDTVEIPTFVLLNLVSKMMLVGGSELPSLLLRCWFPSVTALSTTEDPTRASIPFDKDRDGFMGGDLEILVERSLERMLKNVVQNPC